MHRLSALNAAYKYIFASRVFTKCASVYWIEKCSKHNVCCTPTSTLIPTHFQCFMLAAMPARFAVYINSLCAFKVIIILFYFSNNLWTDPKNILFEYQVLLNFIFWAFSFQLAHDAYFGILAMVPMYEFSILSLLLRVFLVNKFLYKAITCILYLAQRRIIQLLCVMLGMHCTG